jgi:NAD(P)H-hydrate repair Nnr-like enzyme with NAD(P)H-hydrate dehydratase domain
MLNEEAIRGFMDDLIRRVANKQLVIETLDQAAVWAVYLHGAAGNQLKRRMGRLGFLARELSDEIAPLMNSLGRKQSG